MLENMNGDWRRYRAMPRQYAARLVATRRVKRMLEAANYHDAEIRAELKRAAEPRARGRG